MSLFRSISAFSQAGTLDSTFGTNGTLIINTGHRYSAGNAVAIQSDGKILVGGSAADDVLFKDFALVRYMPDGTPDNTFGTNSVVVTDLGIENGEANSIAIQPDGKIILAGFYGSNGASNFTLVRYFPDGSIDNTFGKSGIVNMDFAGYDIGHAIVLQPDGKIVDAGASYPYDLDHEVVRFTTDGSLDDTFGSGGKTVTPIGSGDDAAYSVALQQDGKIVSGGYANVEGYVNFALVRYNENGFPDSTFGVNGIVANEHGFGKGVGVQADGKILLCGYSHNDFALIQYNSDGSVDSSFGTDGVAITDFSGNFDLGNAMVILPEGKIVIAGESDVALEGDFALAQYNPDGSADKSFGSKGKLTTSFGNSSSAHAIALQPDGKVVAAGVVDDSAGTSIAVARYTDGFGTAVQSIPAILNSISISPNPFHDFATVEYALLQDEKLAARLTDASGSTIQNIFSDQIRSKGIHHEMLHMNKSLPAGNYFLVITDGLHEVSVAAVKQ